MTERARREYAEALRPRYAQADKRQRGRMLDEYCRATGSHRKAAIRCLRRGGGRGRRGPGQPRRDGPDVVPTLERVWLARDRLCGKLLAPILPTLVEALERHHALAVPAAVRQALLGASPATLERLLQPLRRQRRRQPYHASPAVAALRAAVHDRPHDRMVVGGEEGTIARAGANGRQQLGQRSADAGGVAEDTNGGGVGEREAAVGIRQQHGLDQRVAHGRRDRGPINRHEQSRAAVGE